MAIQKSNYDLFIIEDDLATIGLITTYFEREGLKCIGATSGNKALKELARIKPKVILLDITLPDLNWYNIAEKIKANKSLKNIPLFLFGDLIKTNKMVQFKQLKFEGIIPKPFCLADFEEIIKYAHRPVIDNITLWNYDNNESIE